MILFADSGSTKTNWIVYNPETKNKTEISTLGINPIVHHHEDIIRILADNVELIDLGTSVETIRFFGAGCSSELRNNIARNAMQTIFSDAKIFIDEDMIAAGIAVCKNKEGIACILGTGSNSIYFDGDKWHNSNAGIGFILGDEASGAYFGKQILRDFLYGLMPTEILYHLKDKYQLKKDDLYYNVYKNVSPNRYLAGFAPILTTFRDTDYAQNLLNEGFEIFFKYHITCFENYKNCPVGFVGSIATHFQQEIGIVANKYGVELGNFIQRPIDEFVQYYTQGK